MAIEIGGDMDKDPGERLFQLMCAELAELGALDQWEIVRALKLGPDAWARLTRKQKRAFNRSAASLVSEGA